jgi:hypothetical protein
LALLVRPSLTPGDRLAAGQAQVDQLALHGVRVVDLMDAAGQLGGRGQGVVEGKGERGHDMSKQTLVYSE